MFNVDALKKKQEQLFEEGERVPCHRTGCWVQMYPPSRPEYKRSQRRRGEALRKQFGLVGRRSNDPLPPEAQEKVEDLILQSICEDLLLGWGDVVDGDGNEVKFTKEIALAVARELVAFREDLLEAVGELSDWQSIRREAISGNS